MRIADSKAKSERTTPPLEAAPLLRKEGSFEPEFGQKSLKIAWNDPYFTGFGA
jgi:hypothetical protein